MVLAAKCAPLCAAGTLNAKAAAEQASIIAINTVGISRCRSRFVTYLYVQCKKLS